MSEDAGADRGTGGGRRRAPAAGDLVRRVPGCLRRRSGSARDRTAVRHLRPHRPRASPARRAPRRLAWRRPDRHHPDSQPHRPGRALPARTRDQRPPQRAHLARHRPGPGHQPRRGPPAIRPRLPGRRRPLAQRHLKPQRRAHFKPSQQRRTRTRRGPDQAGRGQIRPS
jgi:hypothetical protein